MASAATVAPSATASQKSSASANPTALDRASARYRAAQSRYRQAKAALKAIKRQIVPVDAFGNRKPRLRGWLHVVLCGIDYSNIFLIIAGSYTPFAVLLLPQAQASTLLWVVWAGALAGVAFRVFWVGAPRWLYTPAYIALGWTAVFYLPDFLVRGGAAVLTLVVVGGVLYTLGGIVYGIKRPNPLPKTFGFHEVFHALTVVAFTVHYIGVFLALYAGNSATA